MVFGCTTFLQSFQNKIRVMGVGVSGIIIMDFGIIWCDSGIKVMGFGVIRYVSGIMVMGFGVI